MVLEISEYVPVNQAVGDALAKLSPPSEERVNTKRAFGRVAAADTVCQSDIPPYSTSHMDGFALRAEDSAGATEARPARFEIVGVVEVGRRTKRRLAQGEAVRVATGSFLPEGADSVVPVEETRVSARRLSIRRSVPKGSFVFAAGGDVRKGTVLLRKGVTIRAQDVGLLIMLGVPEVRVFRRLRVAILATGNELTNSVNASSLKVRNSHVPVFLHMVRALGCEVEDLGIAPDKVGIVFSRLSRGIRNADLVLTTGGTSVGKLDLADHVVRRLKPQVLHHGIRMDRGRVAGLAVAKGKGVIMMPGPIQGAMNAFFLLGLPMIKKLSGKKDLGTSVMAKLTRRWEARRRFPNFTKVVYLRVLPTKTGVAAEPLIAETESISLLTESNAFAVVPEEVRILEAGHEVEAHLIPGFSFAS
ncbi:MAG: molybdopterin molybdotransferase MoeA [Nitrososphaerales archaeon]|nr:molybdopterin molybdotransferase MoeA [Nitrososphaerales archaeon]